MTAATTRAPTTRAPTTRAPAPTDLELIALAEANLEAFCRFLARLAPGDVGLEPAFRYAKHGRGIWTRSHADAALEAILPVAGFSCAVDLPVMVLDRRPSPASAPAGAVVRQVVDERGAEDLRAADLATVTAVAPGMRERTGIDSILADTHRILEPELAGFVAYVDGAPAAGAISFTEGGVTRVGWVATVPAHRRQGLGDAVTRAVVLAGFDRGARLAVLESSVAGQPLYEAMGFRTVSRYRVWTAA